MQTLRDYIRRNKKITYSFFYLLMFKMIFISQVKDERSLTTPDEANISQHELSRIPKPVDKTIENSHDVYDIQMHPESEQYENRLFEFVNSNRYPRRTYL